MQDQTTAHEIKSREEVVKKLKAAYKIKDDTAENLQRKRAEFLAGFEELGDWHEEQGEMLSVNHPNNSEIENPETKEENTLIDNRHLLKAVALYNMAMASEFYAPARSKENKFQKTSSTEQLIQEQSQQSVSANQQRLIQKIQEIENQMAFSARTLTNSPVPATEQTAETYWQKNQDAKIKLQIIRDQARESLLAITNQAQAIESETYAAQVQQTYHNIAVDQQQLVRELLNDCLQQLPPPEGCIYSIIVLGSLAREEATPYSDFEWAILFEDQDEARNALHKTYFRRLAELLWIKVLNLGETTSRMIDMEGINGKDEETYGPIPKGFSFDGQMADGCHTPLGNKHHTKASIEEINQNKKLTDEQKTIEVRKILEKEYELIGTPHELAQFQQNTWEHKRGLSTVLSTVAVIHSNDAGLEYSLVEQYELEMKQIWNTPEEQTDQRTREVTHRTLIQRRSLMFLAESSESFQFRGGRFDKEAHYFDAKYHLYRLPNMLIDHLASYFGITKQKNLWDRIEAIWGEQSKVPNLEAVKHLKRTISTILTIRSQAYLRKGHRDDYVLMFDPSHPEKNQHLLQTYLGINQTLLFEIFYVLIPLQQIIEEFVETKGTITSLIESAYYDSSEFRQAWIHVLLLNYTKSAELYEEDKRITIRDHGEQHVSLKNTLNNLGIVYEAQGRHADAIAAYEAAKSIKIAHHISVGDTWNNLGIVYQAQGQYIEAIAAYETAKRIFIAEHGEQHSLVANTLNNLGMVYQAQDRYFEAIVAYETAKCIFIAVHGERHNLVADTLNNLGSVYHAQGDYPEAIAAYEAAKQMYRAAYGEEHILLANPWNNLGEMYRVQARYAEAIVAHEEAKRIRVATHGEQHVSVADTLINLGNIYRDQARYAEAIAAYEKAKRIRIVTNGEQHISVAETLHNLGAIQSDQGCYLEAIVAYETAKCIFIAVHGERHSLVADTLNNLGNAYQAQARYAEAIAAHEQAKWIRIATHGEQHISVAETLNNLGVIYQAQGRYMEAIAAYKEAKRIRIATFDEQHILVAQTLNNLGNVYQVQARYEKAIAIYEAAKRIFMTTYGEHHISVAETLNNLGGLFIDEKRFEEARQCFQQATLIYQRFNHPNQRKAKVGFALSYLREGNIFLLQEEMNIEQALRCYQLFNQQNANLHILIQTVDSKTPQSHQQLASLFYESNQLLPTIEHYQILLQLTPNDVSAHHNLACMLHVRAQVEKGKGDEVEYKAYLDEAKAHFEIAIGLERHIGVCTEYALCMWKNRDYFQIETIIAMLKKAITLEQLDCELGYGMMERPTVIEPLQALIDDENSISFKAIYLAYYLLVQIHCDTNQFELVNGDMSLLAAHVIEFNAKVESQKQQLSDQINTLLEQVAPEQSETILNQQQKIIKELEKQQRLANKLVKLSQAIIEAKQKEVAAFFLQTNTEIEQQQIEITEVLDTQSQMLPQPLSGRSTSHAQLISQFSSVIRPPTAENPNVLQQAQTNEEITDTNRVKPTTEEPNPEHESAKKLMQ